MSKKKNDSDAEDTSAPDLTYNFSVDGNLTGVSYTGQMDAQTHASIKAAVLRAREIAKGRS